MRKPLLEKLIQEVAMFDMDAACKLHQIEDNCNDCNDNLKAVMVFRDTPEGLDYWLDIHHKLEARREKYHMHRDIMIEIANDKTIGIEYLKDDGSWAEYDGMPLFFKFKTYRKKPKVGKKVIEYRIYLDTENKIHMIENKDTLPPHFLKWLGDWQKVEIEVEEND